MSFLFDNAYINKGTDLRFHQAIVGITIHVSEKGSLKKELYAQKIKHSKRKKIIERRTRITSRTGSEKKKRILEVEGNEEIEGRPEEEWY